MLAALSSALLAPAAPALAGEALLGVTQGPTPEMVRIDAAAPQSPVARAPVAGLLAGEVVEAIDQRPATGQILALTSVNRVLLLDPATGAVAQPGPPLDPALFAAGQASGIDVNPTVDRLRLVNVADENLRFDPLLFAPVDGDPVAGRAAGHAPGLHRHGPERGRRPGRRGVGLRPQRQRPGHRDHAVRHRQRPGRAREAGRRRRQRGDVSGGGSPNVGLLTTIGPLGVDGDGATSFDIAGPPGGTGTGWAAIRRVGEAASTLYAIDLSPGPIAARASAAGAIGAGPLAGMTVLRGGAIRAAAPPPAPEGAGQAVVRVERGGETLAPTSLAFRTSDRTAVAGRDYVALSGTLDFAQGVRAVDVAIPLLQDAAGEPPEVLALELGAPTGGAVLDAPLVAVEIADDDGPAAADTTRPGYRQTPRRPRSLAALRRTPVMRVRVACTEACRLRLSLSLKTIRLGTARASLRAAGAAVVRLRLSPAGRRALIGPSRLPGRATLVLRATATDPAGNVTTRRQSLRVLRS